MAIARNKILPASTAARAVEVGQEEIASSYEISRMECEMNNLIQNPAMSFTTENNLCQVFNGSASSTLNTPDITEHANFDEIFSRLLEEENINNDKSDTKEKEIETLNSNNTDLFTNQHFPNPMDLLPCPKVEEIWGTETFDDEMLGMCLPAAEVEGRIEETDDKNNDLLQSVIDDHQINALVDVNINEIEFDPPANLVPIDNSNIIIEVMEETKPLKEDEKYRKMRNQNNEASRKCRANRKRKLVEMEEEAEELEAHNKHLREKLASMEAEVASYKKRLLLDIRNKSYSSVSQFIGFL